MDWCLKVCWSVYGLSCWCVRCYLIGRLRCAGCPVYYLYCFDCWLMFGLVGYLILLCPMQNSLYLFKKKDFFLVLNP